MEKTTNYKLNKPATTDFYNVADFNANADIVDAELKKQADEIAKRPALENGKIPETYLPAYVSDVSEHTSLDNFPAAGRANIIYIAKDTGICYRWSGTQYVIISDTIALGETAQTAYRGDHGKVAYDHSQDGNVHLTAEQKQAWGKKITTAGNTNTLKTGEITIPVSLWTEDTTFEEFPYRAAIAVSGITSDCLCKSVVPDHADRSLDDLFCPFVLTGQGSLSIWASEIPNHEIKIESMSFEEVLTDV